MSAMGFSAGLASLTWRGLRLQVALETSILQMVQDIEGGKIVDFRTVADTVLTTAESLTVEAERREAERSAASP